MESIFKLFYLLALVFLVLVLIFNFLKTNFPHLPGDIFIERPNFRLYIPFTSAIVISVILSLVFSRFFK